MENPEEAKPDVEFTLGDKTYSLRATFEVLNKFERATGKDAFTRDIWSSSIVISTFIWAAISVQDSKVTLQDIERKLDWSDFKRLNDAIIQMISGASAKGDPDEKKEEEPEMTMTSQNP
jgi:hypothetical protein